jgi:iron complex outermembrane receptor protein
MSFYRNSLYLLVTAGLTSSPAFAKTDLEHVIVTSAVHKTNAETALPVTVLSGSDLRNNATNSIGETLGSMPGLSNASFGPSVGQPVIRGQQGPRVTVLQNGTGSADASKASADHAVSVEPLLAESIEIMRGPSTFLYGGGAIGGVVNVIDNRIPSTLPEGFTGAVETRYGSVNDESTSVIKLEGALGQFAFHFDAINRNSNDIEIPGYAVNGSREEELEGSDGVIKNTDNDLDSFTFGTSFIGEKSYIGIAINKLDNEYGLPGGSHEHHDEHEEGHDDEHGDEDHDDEEHDEDHDDEMHGEFEGEEEEEGDIRLQIEQTRIDLRGGFTELDMPIETIRWAVTHNEYEHKEIEGSGEVGTVFSNEGWEGRLELVHKEMGGFLGAFGLQVEDSEFSALGEEGFIPVTEIDRVGLFIIEDFHTESAIYEFGARVDYDKYSPDGDLEEESFTNTNLSGSVMWTLDENWKLGTALSSSERAPITEELFSNSENGPGAYVTHAATNAIEVGDTDLDSEQSNNLDMTLSYRKDAIDAYVTFYYNEFDGYIYASNTGEVQDETEILAYVQEDATFYGIEFDVTADIGQALGGDFELQVYGDAVRGELDDNGNVPRMPPFRLGTKLSYQTKPMSLYVSALVAREQDNPGDFEESTDGFTRWDAGMNYKIPLSEEIETLLFVKLKNISDEEIRQSVSFLRNTAPEPGRSAELGIRISF